MERPVTERIKTQERQLDRVERGPGDRRVTACQIEPQEIKQTEEEGEGVHTPP